MQTELLLAFDILANSTVAIDGGNPVPAIVNSLNYSNQKEFNFVEDFDSSIVVKTTDATAGKALIGKTAVINGEAWRVSRVQSGAATTNLFLTSKNRA